MLTQAAGNNRLIICYLKTQHEKTVEINLMLTALCKKEDTPGILEGTNLVTFA